MGLSRRLFTKEFKLAAVRRLEQGVSIGEAARALGSSHLRLMVKHIWPGVRMIALAQWVLVASVSILAEASLSFLGLGDPSAKSWGAMLYFARASGAFLGPSWQWWGLPAASCLHSWDWT